MVFDALLGEGSESKDFRESVMRHASVPSDLFGLALDREMQSSYLLALVGDTGPESLVFVE